MYGRHARCPALPPPDTVHYRQRGAGAATPTSTRKRRSMPNAIYYGDNLPILEALPSESVDLIYIDPPFNTGTTQARTRLKTVRSETGDRTGFQGRRYETTKLGTTSFADRFDDYLAFLRPRLIEAYRVLTPTGSLYFHIDYREVHYCKVLLDGIFGRECFPERDYLGLRLRRPHAQEVAGQARQHPPLRQGPRLLHLQR